jgi:hypothetical protein
MQIKVHRGTRKDFEIAEGVATLFLCVNVVYRWHSLSHQNSGLIACAEYNQRANDLIDIAFML